MGANRPGQGGQAWFPFVFQRAAAESGWNERACGRETAINDGGGELHKRVAGKQHIWELDRTGCAVVARSTKGPIHSNDGAATCPLPACQLASPVVPGDYTLPRIMAGLLSYFHPLPQH